MDRGTFTDAIKSEKRSEDLSIVDRTSIAK
jgi:hypothetical protein